MDERHGPQLVLATSRRDAARSQIALGTLLLKFTFKHGLDSGRYCMLARQVKNEMNAARHSRKVGQPWSKLYFYRVAYRRQCLRK